MYNFFFCILECKDYSEYSKKKINVWGLLLSQNASTVSVTNCDESTPLIRGGKFDT